MVTLCYNVIKEVIVVETKVCVKCNKEFPLTSEYFGKQIKNTDGYKGRCRQCCIEQHKLYYAINKPIVLEKSKQHYKENIDYYTDYAKEYVVKNKEQRQLYTRAWSLNNKDKTLKSCKKYRDAHKDKRTDYNKQYIKTHLENFRIYKQIRKAQIRSLPATLTKTQWFEIKQYFNEKCAYCGEKLPLAQDHFLALSKGGEYSKNNIIPACKVCNSSKHNSDFFIWYPQFENYNKRREQHILKFLRYKNNSQQLSIL